VPEAWRKEWGVADPEVVRGGVTTPQPAPSGRQVWLLQRKPEKPGRGLAKTTGWIHRAALAAKGVVMTGGVGYQRITPEGIEVTIGNETEKTEFLQVDMIVLCAGQQSERALADALLARGREAHVIGGADLAAELDAKRAIAQGTILATSL
jgi:2,4-dienoyl-CoA reductase (NADPH2)